MNYGHINPSCCCFSLRKVTRAVTQLYDRLLEPVGVRATQFTLLVALASSSARTLTEIANTLVMDRTTLTRNLKPLEKMGLIMTVQTSDRRSKAYALTEKGFDIVNRSLPIWEKCQAIIHDSYGAERTNRLLTELGDLVHQVSKHSMH